MKTELKTKLNPCPFCKPELSITKYGYTGMTERFPHWVRCMTCGLEMRSETEMGVIQDWNTRPTEDALRLRIMELEESLHAADSQKAEIEGIMGTLKRAVKDLPSYLIDNCMTIGDITNEMLDEYLSPYFTEDGK